MELLNKAYSQSADLFRSMPAGARIVAGLLLAAIVVSLFFLFGKTAHSADEYLLGGRSFTPSELTAIEVAFGQAGLTNYQPEGSKIRVPRGQRDLYLAALVEGNALPEDFGKHLEEAASGGGLFTTRKEREARLKHAKQRELALIIRRMRGIESATVQYDETDQGGFPRRKRRTAIVAVKPAGSSRLEEAQADSIAELMVHAIAGLKLEDVTVTDLNSGSSYSGGDRASKDPFAVRMRMYERHWEEKIRRAIPPIDGLRLAVYAKLSAEARHMKNSIKYDPRVTNTQSREEGRIEETTTPRRAGRPGLESQQGGPNRGASLANGSQGQDSKKEVTVSESKGVASHDQTSIEMAAFVPERVRVAVGVPVSYLESVWRQQNPTPAGQDPQPVSQNDLLTIEGQVKNNIQNTVRNLLPDPIEAKSPYRYIEVYTFHDLPVASPPAPGMTDKAVGWLASHWTALGMMLLGAVSLLMLRKAMKSTPDPATGASLAGADSDAGPLSVVGGDEPLTEEEEAEAVERALRRKTGGPNLRQELSELVREDPDAAANILRTWIGKAA